MIIGCVIELFKGVESLAQVGAQPWWIVIPDRGIVKTEFMLFIVGEACNLLISSKYDIQSDTNIA